jgi:carbamate kinase
MVEVARDDPAFEDPTKFIGPIYLEDEARRLAAEHGWTVKQDGNAFRRVVPSPKPRRIFELRPIRTLVEQGVIVVCAGGGGIPTMLDEHGILHGVEAVIDKDLASSLLARELEADLLVIATDVDGVYLDWGTEQQRRVEVATPDELEALPLPAGSMGPKVEAACAFVRATGKEAVIGSLADIKDVVKGDAGTRIRPGR